MNPVLTLTGWLQLVGLLALEIVLVIGLAALVQQFTKSAVWRRTIWQVSLLGLLALVACELTGLSGSMIGWAMPKTQPRPASPILVTAESHSPVATAEPQFLEAAELAVAMPMHFSEPLPQPTFTWWPGVVWLVGAVLIAGRTAFARLWFVLRGRGRRVVNDGAWLARVQSLARRLRIRRRIRLTESAGLIGPIAFGIFRPAISLSEGFRKNFTEVQQEAMLVHELAHLAAHDPAWYWLADMVTALLWWHPLAWWVRRQLHAASETAADEASLLIEHGSDVLAECLVELGRRLTQPHSCGWLGIEGSGLRSGLGRRVKRLVTLRGQPWTPVRQTNAWLAKTVGPFVLVALVIASTAWTEPRQAKYDTLGQAFQQSVFGLALFAALPLQQHDPATDAADNQPTSTGANVAAVDEAGAEVERIDWKPWSRDAVAEARAEGRLVLVNFTADWCVAAQVNEKMSLEVPSVQARLRELGVVALRADNTREDEAITSELRFFGRVVPLVLVYSSDPNAPPQVLPEVLTPKIVLDALALTQSSARDEPVSSTAGTSQNNVPALLLEGRTLLKSGKLAEAEAKLNEALKLDPKSEAAKYYLSELEKLRGPEKRNPSKDLTPHPTLSEPLPDATKSSSSPNDDRRKVLVQKLNSIVLDEVEFEGQPLSEVITKLAQLAKTRDPEGLGVNFIIAPQDLASTIVRLQPPLANVTLRQVLDAITKVADRPVTYGIEPYAVVFASKAPLPALYTRWFRVDPSTFLDGSQSTATNAFGSGIYYDGLRPLGPTGALGTWRAGTHHFETLTPHQRLNATARELLTAAGVDFGPVNSASASGGGAPAADSGTPVGNGKQLYFNDRLGMLMVRATLQDLEIIEQAIAARNLESQSASENQPQSKDLDPTHFLKEILPGASGTKSTSKSYSPGSIRGREAMAGKLDSILLDEVAFDDQPLDRAIKKLSEQAGKEDRVGHSVNFMTGPDPGLHTRWFQVDTNTFARNLRERLNTNSALTNPTRGNGPHDNQETTNQASRILLDLRSFLGSLGVDLSRPKSMFFKDRFGLLMFRGTLQDLEIIEQAVQTLNTPPPQLTIEVKLAEVTDQDIRTLGFDWFLGIAAIDKSSNSPLDSFFQYALTNKLHSTENTSTNTLSPTPTGILTDPQYRVVIRALEQRPGVDFLGMPKVTTLSGRQIQIKAATDIRNIFDPGPVIDVVPSVAADGCTIHLAVISSRKQFIGYETQNHLGTPIPAAPVPVFRSRQFIGSANVWDGQTLVLNGGSITNIQNANARVPADGGVSWLYRGEKSRAAKKNRLIFVTPTIVDPAGNRVHTDESMPFRKSAIPPQPPKKEKE